MSSEYMKHIDTKISDSIRTFVKHGVFGESEFLFYSNNSLTGYCSMCEEDVDVATLPMKHNDIVICPKCGAVVQAKNTRYGRARLINEACFYYFEKSISDKSTIVCKGYYVRKRYGISYKEPTFEYDLQAVYIFGNGKSKMYKNNWYSGLGETSSIYDFNIGWLAPKMCYCSYSQIEEEIQDTDYKYIPYKEFMQHYSMVKLFDLYTKYPWIEQLCKIGLTDIIKAKMDRRRLYNCLNYRQKDIFKVLKMKKSDFREIKRSEIDITPMFLRLYQINIKYRDKLSPEEVKQLEVKLYGDDAFDRIEKITKYTSVKKAIKYIGKQAELLKEKESDVLITYSDYLKNCKELGMDMKLESVLFPKNIKKMHDNTMKQVKIQKNTELDNKIQKRLENLNNRYMFQYNGLIIRAAESTGELIIEGSKLNHCVATNYTNRYANGKTVILFIRDLEYENTPYYTVEVNGDRVIQVRGKGNKSADERVSHFMEIYKNEVLEKKNNKNIA